MKAPLYTEHKISVALMYIYLCVNYKAERNTSLFRWPQKFVKLDGASIHLVVITERKNN